MSFTIQFNCNNKSKMILKLIRIAPSKISIFVKNSFNLIYFFLIKLKLDAIKSCYDIITLKVQIAEYFVL